MIVLAFFGGAVGFVILIALSSILNGYVLSVLWGWFMVPTFHVPALTLAPAIGLAMVVSYLTYQISDCEESDKGFGEKIARGVAYAIMKPGFALFAGWIVHKFM